MISATTDKHSFPLIYILWIIHLFLNHPCREISDKVVDLALLIFNPFGFAQGKLLICVRPQSSVLRLLSSDFRPQSSVFCPPPSVLRLPSSAYIRNTQYASILYQNRLNFQGKFTP